MMVSVVLQSTVTQLGVAVVGPQPSTGDALTVLLTAESLLFAAFAVGAALSEKTEFGRPLPTTGELFGKLVFAAIALVAVGGLAAWSDAYINHGIRSPYQGIEAAGILIGILAEVGFAGWTAAALRHS
jgi:hypothetical protein